MAHNTAAANIAHWVIKYFGFSSFNASKLFEADAYQLHRVKESNVRIRTFSLHSNVSSVNMSWDNEDKTLSIKVWYLQLKFQLTAILFQASICNMALSTHSRRKVPRTMRPWM